MVHGFLSIIYLLTMSAKTLRSETVRLIDQNATDFIIDKKKSNNLIEVIGYLEVDCTTHFTTGRTKQCDQCDQCVQCDRSVPRAAGRPVWRARASSAIKRGANYVGRSRSAINAICRYRARQDALITKNVRRPKQCYTL